MYPNQVNLIPLQQTATDILGLKYKEVNHGLNFKNVANISKIGNISELNVGHFIIAQSLFNGLKETISKFREIINESRF